MVDISAAIRPSLRLPPLAHHVRMPWDDLCAVVLCERLIDACFRCVEIGSGKMRRVCCMAKRLREEEGNSEWHWNFSRCANHAAEDSIRAFNQIKLGTSVPHAPP